MSEQTYVCSVVFLDIVQFSQQSNAVQSAWRTELSELLDKGLEGMNPEHRIIVDTGDGAAIAFLLHPEEALSFVRHIYDELPKLRNFAIRVGAHLGPLRVVRGMNGHPNIVGDGINAAQRVMGFAGINEVLVSRAFHEAVIWLSHGNSTLFSPYGMQADKHGREHNLFRMGPEPTPTTPSTSSPVLAVAGAQPERKSSDFYLKAGLGAVLILVVGIGLWTALGSRETSQVKRATPPSTANEPVSAVLAISAESSIPAPALLKASDPVAVTLHEEVQPPAHNKKIRLTTVVASGKVANGKEEAFNVPENCPDCSCSDLMTKLSLGVQLDEKKRRYMDERCRKQ